MKNNEVKFFRFLVVFVCLFVFQQKQIFNNYKVLNVVITVIFNKVHTALIKYIVICIT